MQPRTALLNVGFVLLLLIYFLHAFPAYLAGNLRYAGLIVLSLLLMIAFACLSFEPLGLWIATHLKSLSNDPSKLKRRLIVIVIIGLASLTHFNGLLLHLHFYFQAMIVTLPLNFLNLGTWAFFTILAIRFLLRVPRSDAPIFGLALVWGFVIRILALKTVPYDPSVSDVIFSIDKACASILQGVNPYSQTYSVKAGWSFPFIYPPLLWLPYVPFKAIHWDIRWFNLFAQIPLVLFFWKLVGSRNQSFWPRFLVIFLCVAPDMIFTVCYNQLSHYWFLGAVYVSLVARNKWNWSLLSVTGLVLMRITALTTLWIYLIYLWKRRGFWVAAAHAAMAGALSLICFVPFRSAGLWRFKYIFFDRFTEIAAASGWQFPTNGLSVGGLLGLAGSLRMIMPLQVAGLLIIGAVYAFSKDNSFKLFGGVTVFAYAYFLWLSGFIFFYYWFQPIIMLCAVKLITTGESELVADLSPTLVELTPGSPGYASLAPE